jgi:hypothetical protein
MSNIERAPDYDDKTDEAPVAPPAMAGGVAPALEPNEARQAVTNHNVRYVLGFGVAGIVVAFAVVYFAFFAGGAPPSPT